MPVLPFHRYLGPGNDLDSGSPVSLSDEIARDHDYKYDKAITRNDIYNADQEAINSFVSNIFHSGNPIEVIPSAIGALGLSVKHAVEKATNDVYYPSVIR